MEATAPTPAHALEQRPSGRPPLEVWLSAAAGDGDDAELLRLALCDPEEAAGIAVEARAAPRFPAFRRRPAPASVLPQTRHLG